MQCQNKLFNTDKLIKALDNLEGSRYGRNILLDSAGVFSKALIDNRGVLSDPIQLCSSKCPWQLMRALETLVLTKKKVVWIDLTYFTLPVQLMRSTCMSNISLRLFHKNLNFIKLIISVSISSMIKRNIGSVVSTTKDYSYFYLQSLARRIKVILVSSIQAKRKNEVDMIIILNNCVVVKP